MGNQSQSRGNGFLSTIRNDYGEPNSKLLKTFSKIKTQVAIESNQRILVLQSRRGKLLPQHLQCRSSNSFSYHNDNVSRMYSSSINNFNFMLLTLEIKDICIKIHILKKDLYLTEQKITQTLPPNIYQRFFELECKKIHRIFLAHKLSCKSKFESLSRSKNEDYHRFSSSWFTNLTDTHIPPTVTKTLRLGKNFAIPLPKNQLQ